MIIITCDRIESGCSCLKCDLRKAVGHIRRALAHTESLQYLPDVQEDLDDLTRILRSHIGSCQRLLAKIEDNQWIEAEAWEIEAIEEVWEVKAIEAGDNA
jgi:hypothetical protein